MKLEGEGVFALFVCLSGKMRHRFSRAQNTWFENCRVTPDQCMILTYCFSHRYSYEDAIREASLPGRIISSETVADRYSFCREVCMIALDKMYDQVGCIGGPGKIVEVDETKIGKRKYERGRIVEGHWILGLIERGSVNYRLEICPENSRDERTLLDLIKKHVAPGTEIYTDCWKGYVNLSEHGFIHKTINHSENFVDPNTGVHTQNIESSWRGLKLSLSRGGNRGRNLDMHLCEFLWRRRIKQEKKDLFESFIEAVKDVYSGETE